MNNFTTDFGFVVAFMVGILVVDLTLGDKAATYLLVIVLLSMIIFNWNRLQNIQRRYTSV